MRNSKIRIFYTDDDPDDQMLFSEVVSVHPSISGFTIHNDGQELIDSLVGPEPLPDLIFLDVNMPRMNGLEALKEIRSTDRLNEIPVVVFTTSDDISTIVNARTIGANLFITKPGNYDSFKKAITFSLLVDWSSFITHDNN